jgi:hypothetical protein
VTTTTHVQETHATPEPENASLKTSLLQSSLHALTNVLLQLATHSRDSSKLLLNALLVTSALNLTAIHPEDASSPQLSVTNLLEEQSANVTQLPEYANAPNHLAMMEMHVLLTHMSMELDALTSKNANLTTCA